MTTAAQSGLANCYVCGKVSEALLTRCPRCDSNLFVRKTDSIQRVIAYLITASILYIPANILPMMVTSKWGTTMNSTIIGGVIHLWEQGSYPVSFIIFFASLVIPIAKILALFWLCWSVINKSQANRKQRSRLFRATEFVGRWSMIDIFVVSILVALIQLGGIMTIQPGSAALAFAGVVILTMFAAYSFDPRLMWDANTTEKNNHA